MKLNVKNGSAWLAAALMSLTLVSTQAQTIDAWTGASGGEWNTGANWSSGFPPADASYVTFIDTGIVVNYNLPMVASSIGSITNRGTLNINASGFNSGPIIMTNVISKLFVNAGGVLNVTGDFAMSSNSYAWMGPGSSVNISSRLLIGCGDDGTSSGTVHSFGAFTNVGGILNIANTFLNPANASINIPPRMMIGGGTNNLGILTMNRSAGGNGVVPTYGVDGLTVSNGLVTTTSISLGNSAQGLIYMTGGIWTNSGSFTVKNVTATRPARFVQRGGLFVNTDPNVNIINPSGTGDTVYAVTGGTNYAGGFQFGSGANSGVVLFTNGGSIYVGSAGIIPNGVVTITASLIDGGMFGAYTDWTNGSTMSLRPGTFTFQAGDANGTPHNIYCSGVLTGSGTGTLKKTGTGNLILGAVNTYPGMTLVNNGTLTLDVSGTLASTPIIVANTGIYDVSLVGGGYILNSGQTLSGYGVITGAVAAASGSIIDPGTNTGISLNSVLSFSNSLTEAGGVLNRFHLSNNALGASNDLVYIAGDFTVSGSNTVQAVGNLPAGSHYPLFKYGGNFIGSEANFGLLGAVGILSNSPATKTIYLNTLATTRGPSSITWVGNLVNTNWDTGISTNWLLNGSLDFFITSDSVRFDSTGAANNNVNLPSGVSPTAVTVDSTANYFIGGTGSIDGTAGLTKTNTGTLTITSTNTYTGVTTINGGILSVSQIANELVPSGLGAASAASGNLVINSGTLLYNGPVTSTDRGVTVGSSNSTINVSANGDVTIAGIITGGGSLTKFGPGGLILNAVNSYSGSTVVSNGTLTLSGVSSASSGTIILNGGNLSIGAVKPANLIAVSNSAVITGGNAGGLTGTKNVTGTANLVLAVSPGVFDLTGDMSTYSGVITFSNASGAVVRLNGSTGSPLATWDLGAGPMDLNVRTGSTSNNIGALRGAAGTTLSGRGGSSNNGGTTFYIGANGLSTTFDGIIQNGGGGSSSITSVNKVGGGTLALSGANTYTGTTTISGGVIALIVNGVLSSSTINITAGTALDVSGLSTPTLFPGSSQTLTGNGTLRGSLDLSSGGTVAPGATIGNLTVTNTVSLAGGTALIRINRSNTPNASKLISLSTLTLGGTLVVTNIGPALQVGDTFTVLSTPMTGTFSGNVVLPVGYTWNTANLEINGTISVSAVAAPPAFTSVDFSTLSGGTITFNATGGQPGEPFSIITTTNLLLPVAQWTTIASGNFDGSGNLSGFGVSVGAEQPQSFYRLVAQ